MLTISNLLFFSSFSLSLKEAAKTSTLNKIVNIWKRKKLNFIKFPRKWIEVNKRTDVKKTRYLNTAIIEKEWTISLNNDICVGPKYLIPLIEFTSL